MCAKHVSENTKLIIVKVSKFVKISASRNIKYLKFLYQLSVGQYDMDISNWRKAYVHIFISKQLKVNNIFEEPLQVLCLFGGEWNIHHSRTIFSYPDDIF